MSGSRLGVIEVLDPLPFGRWVSVETFTVRERAILLGVPGWALSGFDIEQHRRKTAVPMVRSEGGEGLREETLASWNRGSMLLQPTRLRRVHYLSSLLRAEGHTVRVRLAGPGPR